MSRDSSRAPDGRFGDGNPGGPGRPRRAVEADYLRSLSDHCALEAWTGIVDRAVSDAENGDAKAREWIGRYVISAPAPGALADLAARDEVGKDQFDERVKELRLSPMDRLRPR